MKASANVGVQEIRLEYFCNEKNQEVEYSKSFERDKLWYPGEGQDTCEVEIDLNEFTKTGKYTLKRIWLVGFGSFSEVIYRYDETEKAMVKWYPAEEPVQSIPYNGEIDYTVAVSEKEDLSIPEIISVRRVTTGDIYSNTEIQYEVEYKEEGSGIKEIRIGFENDVKMELGDHYAYSGSGSENGTGKIIISSDNRTPGKYHLESIVIEDFAGNQSIYSKRRDGTDYITYVDGEEQILPVSSESYEVKLFPYNGIKLKGIRMGEGIDKDDLSASGGESRRKRGRKRDRPDIFSGAWRRRGDTFSGADKSLCNSRGKEFVFN